MCGGYEFIGTFEVAHNQHLQLPLYAATKNQKKKRFNKNKTKTEKYIHTVIIQSAEVFCPFNLNASV